MRSKLLKRKKVFQGYCFEAVVDEVIWPNQKRLERSLILHPGISVILPVLDRHRLILIRQYRYGADKVLWELPAGTLRAKESPLSCARRELVEEIGYRARAWRKLGQSFSSPGLSTEQVHCFVASDLQKTKANLEHDEILEPHILSVSQVKRLIAKRSIVDAKSLIPLFYWLYAR